MFQLLEVVGLSDKGFSEAVKDAITKVSETDEKIHWFEVLDQRGALRDGKIQYQVKLKIAVLVETKEDKGIYLCQACGGASDKANDLCSPKKVR